MTRAPHGRWPGAAAIALIALAGATGVGAQAPSARDTALAQLTRNDPAEARVTIERGLKRRPREAGLIEALGQVEWRVLDTASALRAFEQVQDDRQVGADAALGIGRIRAFRGWQAEAAFPGWHEEVDQRPLALAAYRRAIALRPAWVAPHVALGDALLLDGQADAALTEYAAALALAPADVEATRGRDRAQAALGRGPAVRDPEDAELAAIDALLKSGDGVQAATTSRAFITAHPSSLRLVDAYDRLLASYQVWPDAPARDITSAVERRIGLRPDPAAYYSGAALMLARPPLVGIVRVLATAGAAAGERFISENRSSYKLAGKVQGARDRNAAQAADLIGWAAYLQGDRATAGTKLEEAARLSNGADFANQFHRAELARALGDAETARERYYDALSLQGGAPAQRTAARAALAAIYAADGTPAADAATAIDRDLERRREERRLALVGSAIGKTLPAMPVTTVAGTPVDLLAEHGNVTLLNFFAAW